MLTRAESASGHPTPFTTLRLFNPLAFSHHTLKHVTGNHRFNPVNTESHLSPGIPSSPSAPPCRKRMVTHQNQTPSSKPLNLVVSSSRSNEAPRNASDSVRAMVQRLEGTMTPDSPPGAPRARSSSSPVSGRVKGLAKRLGGLVKRGGGVVSERADGQADNVGDATLNQGCVVAMGEKGDSMGEEQAYSDCSSVYSQDGDADTAKGIESEHKIQRGPRDTRGHSWSPAEARFKRNRTDKFDSTQDETMADTPPRQHQPSIPKARFQIPETPFNDKPTTPKTLSGHPASSPAMHHLALSAQPASPSLSPRRNPANVAF